jgi:hypothetical protein
MVQDMDAFAAVSCAWAALFLAGWFRRGAG